MNKVFYDGKCGLCRREIGHYQKIASPSDFHWIDITEDRESLAKAGLTFDVAIRRMHAQDEYGNLYKGVDAFILIWKHLPRWKYLAVIITLPVVKQIANIAYNRFADWRIDRLHAARCAIQIE